MPDWCVIVIVLSKGPRGRLPGLLGATTHGVALQAERTVQELALSTASHNNIEAGAGVRLMLPRVAVRVS